MRASASWWVFTARCMLLVGAGRFCVALLDVSELNDVAYDIAITDVPLGFEKLELMSPLPDSYQVSAFLSAAKATAEDKSSLRMTSEYGQKFVCTLPAVQETEREEIAKGAESLTVGVVADVVAAAFYVRGCIKKSTGWWTYELCYGKHIDQLHFEGNTVVGGRISLGYYSNNSELPQFEPKPDRQLYFEQHYTNGTVCDLNSKPRNTLVQYTCDELLATNEAYIDEVDERATCDYVLKVKTGSLCKLKPFQPVGKPRPPLSVECRPLLDDDAAAKYLRFLIKKQNERVSVQARVDRIMGRIVSLKRQLGLRKRLALISPKAKKESEMAEKKLSEQLDEHIKVATQLASQAEGVRTDKNLMSKADSDYDTVWESEADEDRASVYWYFKDGRFDRSFFPMTVAYVRARNKYYTILSSFYGRFGETFDDTLNPYSKFIQDAESGRISEIDLALLVGPLPKIFSEDDIPGIMPRGTEITTGGSFYENIFTSERLVDDLTHSFQNSLTTNLTKGDVIDPQDVMSKCARQILKIRALSLDTKKNEEHIYSYLAAEKIYFQFEKAYSDAVEHLWKSKPDLFIAAPGDKSLKRAPFLPDQDSNHKATKNGKLADAKLHMKSVKWKRQEEAAGIRMRRRARRINIGRKLEEFFRRPSDEEKPKLVNKKVAEISKNVLKLQLQLFTRTLEEQLRETGIADGGEVKVHLVTSSNAALIDDRLSSLLEAFFGEQTAVNEEKKTYMKMRDAYMFGASEAARKAANQRQPHNPFLPILRRAPV